MTEESKPVWGLTEAELAEGAAMSNEDREVFLDVKIASRIPRAPRLREPEASATVYGIWCSGYLHQIAVTADGICKLLHHEQPFISSPEAEAWGESCVQSEGIKDAGSLPEPDSEKWRQFVLSGSPPEMCGCEQFVVLAAACCRQGSFTCERLENLGANVITLFWQTADMT